MNDTVILGTVFQNIDTNKFWNETDKKWVDTIDEATNYGHRKLDPKKFVQPARSIRVRI